MLLKKEARAKEAAAAAEAKEAADKAARDKAAKEKEQYDAYLGFLEKQKQNQKEKEKDPSPADSKLPFHFDEKPATRDDLSVCEKGVICSQIGKVPVVTCKEGIHVELQTIDVSQGKTLAFD